MKFVISSILLIFLCSCSNNMRSKPSGLISPDKMSLVLEDVLLLESYYQSKYGVPGLYKDALDQSIDKVFKKHGVNRKQFKTSYTYYASHPEDFKSLNTSVMDRLSRERP